MRLNEIIGVVTAPLGFKRKRAGVWVFDDRSITNIVSLQRSTYTPRCYVIMGICLNRILDVERPKPEDFHIMARVHSFSGASRERNTIYDQTFPEWTGPEEVALIRTGIETFFEHSRSMASLTDAIRDETFAKKALVKLSLREALLGVT